MVKNKSDISIVISGEAGQGIQTIEYLLDRVLKLSGFNIFSTSEFMSRIRGGANSTEIRISSKKNFAFVSRIDVLISLSKNSMKRLERRMSPETIIIGEKENINEDFLGGKYTVIDIPISEVAEQSGGKIYSNTIVAGIIVGLLKVEHGILDNFLREQFLSKGEDIVQKNIFAGKKGYDIGADLLNSGKVKVDIEKDPKVKDDIVLNGIDAVSIGVIAGGCNFISAYPMSPSTGVLTFLAQNYKDFDIFVEQAEDEISALNMALGASYAGARAMVTTSGGGFALMEEAVSLAGAMELPIVIHIAQRPGPATGLPTRTEQADLELALYSGHGEFPRIILSPGTLEDAFYLSQQAFNLADKYQIPVFILTDQFFVDSYSNIPMLDLSKVKREKYIVKVDKNYKRYKFTDDGISPRGVPGFGDGFVVADGHEHDEEGHISEDFEIRTKMVNKRLKKLDSILKDVFPPELIGSENYKTLVIGWGSTFGVIKEALEELGRDDISFLYYKQVYPLHPSTADYLKKAEKTIIVENNATSQFGKLIKLCTGIDIQKRVLKYSGEPFTVEEVISQLVS